MKNEKLIIGFITLLLFVGGTAFSQEIVTDEDSLFGADETEEISTDENSLFGSEDDEVFLENSELIEEVAEDMMKDLSQMLLRSDTGVETGGYFFFDLSADWTGFDPGDPENSDTEDSLSMDLGTTLFLDARPDKDTRVFAKADITAPFYTLPNSSKLIQDGRSFEDIVTITELFADFNWDNQVFFRAGKQTINWGVGYFFSPGDLLSLSRIDPESPDAELDGPIALKINYPSLLNNYYLYTVVPDTVESYSEIAIAPMAEFVIGNSEISFGAYYQYDKAPAAMTAITSAIGDISIYGEGYISYGSDRIFIEINEKDMISTEIYDNKLFYKGTAGASYSWSDDFSNYNLSFSGQYYYNGEGYEDMDLVNINETPGLIASGIVSAGDPSSIAALLVDSGRHYGAASASWREMWGSDFTFSVFFIENFSSLSGMIKPSVSWGGLDGIDLTLSLSRMFGDEGEEYAVAGSTAAVSLGVSIGGTSF